jgi:amino-acid N-acetyltransferase
MSTFVENRTRELGLTQVFALSTQAFTCFQSKAGFTEGTPDDLPPARREKYECAADGGQLIPGHTRPALDA